MGESAILFGKKTFTHQKNEVLLVIQHINQTIDTSDFFFRVTLEKWLSSEIAGICSNDD